MNRLLLAALSGLALTLPANAQTLRLPVDCAMGETCFIQQYPDMDPGPDGVDPFCGGATYDGHDGTDIRLRALSDIEAGIAVVAVAPGNVSALRDGMEDLLVTNDADAAAVADIECGNGVIVDHGDGLETQYCHLRNGSITVAQGDAVEAGDRLGDIGASGLAQFPHVHLSVRQDGVDIDPTTGRALSEGCAADADAIDSLWDTDAAAIATGPQTQLIGSGLAGDVIDHDALTANGPPDPATTTSGAIVGYGWFINLEQGDEIALALTGPDGGLIAEDRQAPLDGAMASYSAYVGTRGAPEAGEYVLALRVIRGGEIVIESEERFEVR